MGLTPCPKERLLQNYSDNQIAFVGDYNHHNKNWLRHSIHRSSKRCNADIMTLDNCLTQFINEATHVQSLDGLERNTHTILLCTHINIQLRPFQLSVIWTTIRFLHPFRVLISATCLHRLRNVTFSYTISQIGQYWNAEYSLRHFYWKPFFLNNKVTVMQKWYIASSKVECVRTFHSIIIRLRSKLNADLISQAKMWSGSDRKHLKLKYLNPNHQTSVLRKQSRKVCNNQVLRCEKA